ncbi:MAG: hypothetical protein M0R17_02390 [Candidatus Omnitrophica bacterium]|jgi:hypothetical protein|nr:hypothetical protein [Candidatus Omnitrophota bacterium]
MFDLETKYQLKAFVGTIAGLNYFNDTHKIIRLEFNNKFYDFKFISSNEVPNPSKHLAIVITSEEFLSDNASISEERLNYLPGIVDKFGNIGDLPLGFVYIINKKQTVSVTNPNSGGAGFAINNTNMFDYDKIAVSISPPLDNDYTNTEKDDNKLNKNVGIFINHDGTILVKSKGGSITLGEEGIYLAGNIAWESSEHQREWMMDNGFHRFIPSTMVSFALALPEFPNLTTFANIGNAAQKVLSIVKKVSNISKIVGK